MILYAIHIIKYNIYPEVRAEECIFLYSAPRLSVTCIDDTFRPVFSNAQTVKCSSISICCCCAALCVYVCVRVCVCVEIPANNVLM